MSSSKYFIRQAPPHDTPSWVADGEIIFITICVMNREMRPLLQPGVPEQLLAAARHYHESGRWWIRLFLIMPDHVHALVAPFPETTLRKIVSSWKSYTAKIAGVSWQKNFFDHRPRNLPALEEKEQYILQNPVRRGLVKTPATWPHVLRGSDLLR